MVEIHLNKEALTSIHERVSLSEDEMTHICNTIVDTIRDKTPRRSGRLASSMRLEGTQGNYGIHALSYFHYLNKGTRDHWIFPIHALALRWVDELGNVHFSKGHKVSGIVAMHIIDVRSLITLMKDKTLDIITNKL